MYALTHCQIYTGHQILTQHAVIIDKNKIQAVCHEQDLPLNIKKIDLKNTYLSSGFIDLQLNGCGGVQFNDSLLDLSTATLQAMQHNNEKFGCCNYLPTLISSSDEFIRHAVDVMRNYLKKHHNQALGLHLEGPYISQIKKGTHNAEQIRRLTPKMRDFLINNADVIKKITLAPEEVSLSDIHCLKNAGIVISCGHSNASYEQAMAAFTAGSRFSTNLFNAMPAISARNPGLIAAVLESNEVYAGIIADGQHVAWANIRLAKKIKGNKLLLVTDATAAAGADIAQFNFAGKTIYVRDGLCVDENGTLSGSSLTMIDAIANCVHHANIPLDEALRMASLYPAKAIGIENQLGSIECGKIANLCSFNESFTVTSTVVNGTFNSYF